ncbi:UNVERIFIED_CONTAM: hypothetical protein FKN15_059880 [Acipenser sinensis]
MVVISVLNTIIANQLIQMFKQAAQDSRVCTIGGHPTMLSVSVEPSRVQSLRHGVKVLPLDKMVPLLIFFSFLFDFYHYFYMVTNVLFYVSSTVNPVLYNLVSANYRQIFMSTLSYFCLPWRRKRKRPALARHFNSITSNQTFSSNIIKETMY